MSTKAYELRLTDQEEGLAIRNLWPLYAHDLTAYNKALPNRFGVISDDAERTELHGPGGWWGRADDLFPYLILVDGVPAGFHLIATGSFVEAEEDVQWVAHEFFVVRGFRGTGVAEWAAKVGIEKHPGTWEIVTYPNAAGPIRFWRKALKGYGVRETEEDHPWGRKVVFRFEI